MIPRVALYLGLAGVLPFAITAVLPLFDLGFAARELVTAVRTLYAVTILAFMSGCIWAFSAQENDRVGYALSVLPALYGWFVPLFPVYLGLLKPKEATFLLAFGFVALLLLDQRATRRGQTPDWWLRLRVLLTFLAVLCLMGGVLI